MAKKTCFVIGPIGDPTSETRDWANAILNYIIELAVTACGYDKPIRADHISQVGMITPQILEHIIGDDLVIADLTERNPNVYYELAVRHAARKAFIQVIKEGQSIPFDLQDLRTIPVGRDIMVAENAKQQLQRYIPEVEKQGDTIVTPISMAASLELMRESGDVRQQELADVISKLDNLTSLVRQTLASVEEPPMDREPFTDRWRKGVLHRHALKMLRHGMDRDRLTNHIMDWAGVTRSTAYSIVALALSDEECARIRGSDSLRVTDHAAADITPGSPTLEVQQSDTLPNDDDKT